MTGGIEVFLDDTPGEVRGMVARDGRFERLIIQREGDSPQARWGARSVGRVVEVQGTFRGAFVELGGIVGFLPLSKRLQVREGQRVSVEVVAEPRERKGPTLKLLGPGEGEPRLVQPGPDVAEQLATLAPDVPVQTGLTAIQASWDAEEEALADGDFFAEAALDLAVQRTRALIAVDVDYAHLPGRDARKGRERANRLGLVHAARLIRLKSWGGLVAIDLVGAIHDSQAVTDWARAAFGADPDVAFGPLSRFGLLQLTTPWRHAPIEEVLSGWDRSRLPASEAIALTRRLRHQLLSDPATPRFVARCTPAEAKAAAPLVARLGPRAGLRPDPTVIAGRAEIDEG